MLSSATPCGSSSGSCQLSLKSKNLHHNAGNYNKRLSYNDGVLSLNYSGGDVCFHSKTKRQTLISFVCDPKVTNDSLSKPVFVAETDDCSYYFTWHTRLACERKVRVGCLAVIGWDRYHVILRSQMSTSMTWSFSCWHSCKPNTLPQMNFFIFCEIQLALINC